jgi:hypothetical protein
MFLDRSKSMMLRALTLGGLLLAAAATTALAPAPAEARGFVSFGIGVPVGPAYYPAPAYYPPAYYYAPPPAYYYPPPPVAYTAPPPPVAAPAPVVSNGEHCREYQSSSTIDGRPQQTYGTACQQPDGTWRIIN